MKKKDWWYERLVNQSKTDHIYSLIHHNIPYNWETDEDNFVVLNVEELPDRLKLPVEKCISIDKQHFQAEKLRILHSDHLMEFLEAATFMIPIRTGWEGI